jgi:type IV pilus assembly protein PilC
MPKFKISAINKDGEKYEGSRDSNDKFSLYEDLKSEGETLISAVKIEEESKMSKVLSVPFSIVPEHQKIIFVKNLGSMISAGLPLARCLSILEKKIKNTKFKNVILSMETDIRKGKTLSDSAKNYPRIFSNLFVSMVRAGEESGKLSESLTILGDQLESSYKLKKKIKGAMIYPTVIIFIMLVIGVLMMILVVPTLATTFKDLNTELPTATKILLGSSDFLTNNLIIVIIGTVLFFIAFYMFLATKLGKRMADYILLRLPVIGELVRETNSSRISRTISSLLSSGVPFSEALSITSDVVQNVYFKELLNEAKLKVEKGETISSVFLANTKLSPVFVGEMMNVGEETGRLPSMLLEVAIFYENSVDQKTKDMSTIIEPVLMVIIGSAVGFFALAMISPIYSVMDNVK